MFDFHLRCLVPGFRLSVLLAVVCSQKEEWSYPDLEDLVSLERLEEEADRLWPAWPCHLTDMASWLERANAFGERLVPLRAKLEKLRERAAPKGELDRNPEAETLERLLWQRSCLSDGDINVWVAQREKLDAAIAAVRSRVAGYRVYRFESARDQFTHDRLAELIEGLEKLIDPDPRIGTIQSIRERIVTAEKIARSGEDSRDRWSEVLESTDLDSPLQGLVPIGRDPQSGLWEFAHLLSGAIPERDDSDMLLIDDDSSIVLVFLPGGTFAMGARAPSNGAAMGSQNVDPQASANESPVHDVTLSSFLMSKFEMTQGQWFRVTGEKPSQYGPDVNYADVQHTLSHPVEHVSWHECSRVLWTLGLELPTEAQWEYAARAGTTTPWCTGNDRDTLIGAANLADEMAKKAGADWGAIFDWPGFEDGYGCHSPVGAFQPNGFGLHDVHGNLWEWCRDRLASYELPPAAFDGYRQAVEPTDPVARGGSYNFGSDGCRITNRGSDPAETRSWVVGVRPSLSLRH